MNRNKITGQYKRKPNYAAYGMVIVFGMLLIVGYTYPKVMALGGEEIEYVQLSQKEIDMQEWLTNVEAEEAQNELIQQMQIERDEYLIVRGKEITAELETLQDMQASTTASVWKLVAHSGLVMSTSTNGK